MRGVAPREQTNIENSFWVRVRQMNEKNRKMIALSLKMVQVGKRMEAERRELAQLVQSGMGYDSPEMKTALERYLKEKAVWEETERDYLTLRDGQKI